MRYLILSLLLSLSLFGDDAVDFFKASPENRLMCKATQYAYKVVSQKNATLVKLDGHEYFKINAENLYILKTGCHPIDGKKETILF
jgi:hypothetical protein